MPSLLTRMGSSGMPSADDALCKAWDLKVGGSDMIMSLPTTSWGQRLPSSKTLPTALPMQDYMPKHQQQSKVAAAGPNWVQSATSP